MAKSNKESNSDSVVADAGEPIQSGPDPVGVVADAGIDEIGSTLLDELPEVQQHAIDQHAQREAEIAAEYADLRDSDGNPFDAAIHKTNSAGEPTLSTKGKLIKKPGRKAGSVSQSIIGGAGKSQPLDENQTARAAARVVGKSAANMLLTASVALGGEEWQPVKNEQYGLDEKSMLETAFADYFEATGKTDFPPGVALAIALTAYAGPRFTMPKTRSRMGRVRDWFAKKMADRKLRKLGLKSDKSEKADK